MATELNIILRGHLEDLPAEVVELLSVVCKKLSEREEEVLEVITRLRDCGEVGHCLVDLEKIRRELYKVDNRLSDCMSILSAYEKHTNSPPAPQTTPAAAPEEGGSDG